MASIISDVKIVVVKTLEFNINISRIYIIANKQEAIFLYFLFLGFVNGLFTVSAGANKK